MRILYLSFAIIVKGLTVRDFAMFDEKLRSYQNMTGIDETTFNEIWEAGITNGKNKLYLNETLYLNII